MSRFLWFIVYISTKTQDGVDSQGKFRAGVSVSVMFHYSGCK